MYVLNRLSELAHFDVSLLQPFHGKRHRLLRKLKLKMKMNSTISAQIENCHRED